MEKTLYEAAGGLPTLQKVHKIFYDKVYAHDWLKLFFAGHDQKAIEDRQTSFMAEKMGGPDPYPGKEIRMVHEAMYITPELFEIRMQLLDAALQEAGVDARSRERWLKIDAAFRKHVVKDSVEAMYDNDWKYKKPIIIPKPET
jgi:hemoglobin